LEATRRLGRRLDEEANPTSYPQTPADRWAAGQRQRELVDERERLAAETAWLEQARGDLDQKRRELADRELERVELVAALARRETDLRGLSVTLAARVEELERVRASAEERAEGLAADQRRLELERAHLATVEAALADRRQLERQLEDRSKSLL